MPVAFATDTVGESAPGGGRGARRRRRRAAGEPPVQPGRDQPRTTPSAAPSPTQLAALADVFVSDGFGVVHRKQASVYDVAQRLPHAAGGLVLAEVDVLRRLTEDPSGPYAVVLGGAKVSDKLGVIDNLLGTADRLLIGGGMVFTFLEAQGHEVGKSLLEADQLDTVRGYLDQAAERGRRDRAAGRHRRRRPRSPPTPTTTSSPPTRSRPTGWAWTSGPSPASCSPSKLADARTVFWNGPMGVFEMAPYAEGTRARRPGAHRGHRDGRLTVVGGGDSAAAVRQLGFDDDGSSATSPPVAARAWSTSRARRCPA